MDLAELCVQTVEIAKQVGGFIREESRKFQPDQIEYKGFNDLVSYVDKSAEEQLVQALSSLLPEAGFLTEEKTRESVGEVFQWIIDPLDGTTNFIHGIPTYSVSIALQQNQELVLGVVYEINRDECFYAWKGGSAWLNDRQIHVSKVPQLSNTLLATGFPYYDFEKKEPYLKVFQEMMENCHGLRRIGSAAVDLAYVACGRFDGYFEYNLNAWDVAAGALIVKEAGGELFDFSGGTDFIQKRELVATNSLISKEMLHIIAKYFKSNTNETKH